MSEKVIVVGAGPVGLITALGLAQAGIEVEIVDRDTEIGTSPRAIAHWFMLLPEFEKLGVLEELVEAGYTGTALNYVDFETKEIITHDLSPLEGRVRHPFNFLLGQHRVSAILLKRLNAYPNVSVRLSTTVVSLHQDTLGVELGVETETGHETLRADWLVGADGASSTIRRELGLTFDGMTWPERLISTNIKYDFIGAGYGDSNFVLHPTYGALIANIEGDLWRCTYVDGSADDPDDETIVTRMHDWMQVALPGASKDFELIQYSPYRIHQRAASSFREGRVVLAGDAAHVTNPIGGLGLTTGFADAFILYEALAAVIAGDEPDSILDDYAEERKKAFLEVTSPVASHNKVQLYNMHDRAALEQDLAELREIAVNPELRGGRLMFLSTILTHSVVGRG
jgi:3-(3-hydroxy-phenyl)propionate hydroxylase/6-hydroxy-3-succinoylpyridine 3-monooxygenase